MSDVIYKGNRLINGDVIKELRNPIKKIELFTDRIVVLLERELNTDFFENVIAFDYALEFAWQIQNLPQFDFQGKSYVGINKPYIDISKISENELVLFNYDGTQLKVNPLNGELLSNPMESRVGKRPW